MWPGRVESADCSSSCKHGMALAPGRWHTQSPSKATNRWADFLFGFFWAVSVGWHISSRVMMHVQIPIWTRACNSHSACSRRTHCVLILLVYHVHTHTYTHTWNESEAEEEQGVGSEDRPPLGCLTVRAANAQLDNRPAPLTLNLIRTSRPRWSNDSSVVLMLTWLTEC